MKLKLLFISGLMLLVFFSCKKENTRYSYQTGIEGAQSYVEAQQFMTQILNTYFKSLTDSVLKVDGKSKIDGADVYYYTDPERLAFKYPWWGNDDGYGQWRANSFEAVPRTTFEDEEVIVDVFFYDFQYNHDTINVKNMLINHLGRVDGVNEHFQVSCEQVENIYADTSGVSLFSFDEGFVMYKDQSTIYTSPEDEFSISGMLNGTSKNSVIFNSLVDPDSLLLNNFSCNWLNTGKVDISVDQFNYDAHVYFSEKDTCQNQYLILINDNPFPYPID